MAAIETFDNHGASKSFVLDAMRRTSRQEMRNLSAE
jgi:hypothetical protein